MTYFSKYVSVAFCHILSMHQLVHISQVQKLFCDILNLFSLFSYVQIENVHKKQVDGNTLCNGFVCLGNCTNICKFGNKLLILKNKT